MCYGLCPWCQIVTVQRYCCSDFEQWNFFSGILKCLSIEDSIAVCKDQYIARNEAVEISNHAWLSAMALNVSTSSKAD